MVFAPELPLSTISSEKLSQGKSSGTAYHYNHTLEEKRDLLRLARIPQLGPISYFHLLQRYGGPQEVLDRLPSLIKKGDLRIPTIQQAQEEMDYHEKKGFGLLSFYDTVYPQVLRHLKDPPPFLSVKGHLSLLKKTLFAIVGSRNASVPSVHLSETIAQDLSRQGWVIVSGLAKGIDTGVHRGALKNGTIAVIPGGLGNIYPPENKDLYHAIEEEGLVISEDAFHQGFHPSLFSKRNRLISGLSWGVLIVEASLRSGSLMTAKYAADQGKIVFAVPGHPLDFRSKGTNKLLKNGAFLVEDATDIFEEYKLCHQHLAENDQESFSWNAPSSYTPSSHEGSFSRNSQDSLEESPEFSALYKKVYDHLTMTPVSINALGHYLSLDPKILRSLLVMMEVNGDSEFYPGDTVLRLSSEQRG